MSKNGVLVVTGGSRGIGAATALLAAERGYAVVVNYAGNVGAAEKVCATIHASGGQAIAVRGDVGKPEDIEHIFAAADRLGTLTGLVNNAGVVATKAARIDELELSELQRLLDINITGSVLCAAAAIRRMSTRHGGKGGSIVNLTSAAAKLGGAPTAVAYATTKGAIDTFTIGLALEVAGEGIRVNAVRPGIIDTEMHGSGGDPGRVARIAPTLPMPRAGTADEVARAILWLLSDEASYTTGTTIDVTGGRENRSMTTELWLLFWSLPLYGLYFGAQTLIFRMHYGLMYTAGARDEQPPEGILLGRAERALKNFQETWNVFIILMLIAHSAAPGDPLIFWGAMIYFAGRVVYLPLYLFGTFGIRSLFWNIATFGLGLIMYGVLF